MIETNGRRPARAARARDAGRERPGRQATRPAPGGGPADLRGPKGRRKIAVAIALVVLSLAALYFVLPQVRGPQTDLGAPQPREPLWLAAACGVELLSILGYAVLFRTVFGRDTRRLDWRASIQIPLAGIAAIRLVAAAGAGAVALTVWALGRAGMEARVIASRMVANLLVQYAVYLFAVLLFGLALGLGILPGHRPFELTILPAILSIALAAAVVSAVLVPADVERRLARVTRGPRWWRSLVRRLATAPAALGDGARTAAAILRERPPGLLGAVAYWGFDIAALGCSFLAFGGRPAIAVLILCYFLGTLGSLLPLPGGIGGVEGAMIGSSSRSGYPATRPWSRSSPIARSPSGCRRCRGSRGTSRCAARSIAGSASRMSRRRRRARRRPPNSSTRRTGRTVAAAANPRRAGVMRTDPGLRRRR